MKYITISTNASYHVGALLRCGGPVPKGQGVETGEEEVDQVSAGVPDRRAEPAGGDGDPPGAQTFSCISNTVPARYLNNTLFANDL